MKDNNFVQFVYLKSKNIVESIHFEYSAGIRDTVSHTAFNESIIQINLILFTLHMTATVVLFINKQKLIFLISSITSAMKTRINLIIFHINVKYRNRYLS